MMSFLYSLASSIGSVAMTIIVFLIIFGILIILHECGHFWAARAAKVKVLEFGFGMPPKVFGKKTSREIINEKGEKEIEEMEWTLNAIPFGGFVRMLGEDGNSEHPNAFGNRPLLWRMLVICGGVIMNFLLGWALFTFAFTVGVDPSPISKEEYESFIEEGFIAEKEGDFVMESPIKNMETGDIITGYTTEKNSEYIESIEIERFNAETKQFKTQTLDIAAENKIIVPAKIQIKSIQKDSPAEKSGLEAGDVLESLNGEMLISIEQLREASQQKETMKMIIMRMQDEEIQKEITITPTQEGLIGISSGYYIQENNTNIIITEGKQSYTMKQVQYPFFEAGKKSFFYSFEIMGKSIDALGNLVSQLTSSLSIPDEMGGPVAIAHQTDTILEYGNFMSLVTFTAMLSLSLAVLNIMPFPGLDGGRFIFLLLEGVLLIFAFISQKVLRIQKPFPTRLPSYIEGWINALGFLTLLALLFWITGNDVIKLFL